MRQLIWVIDCLDDIASDMSVFHRVDDITLLDGPTLFRLAWRLPSYEGAMRARVRMAAEETDAEGTPSAARAPSPGGRDWNPGTQTTLMADPDLKGLFSFG